jgi:small nuclear ribonucleoprotein (snRNP)-like protein
MLIELKNGDTYNGRLVKCDMFMNINLRDVICTSKVCKSPNVAFRSEYRVLRTEIDFGNSLNVTLEGVV